MIYFDLESHLGTLYKIEAIFWENGKPKDKFFAVTNADMPDAVRRITCITHEQSLTGTDERETVFAFWNFLQRNHAVAPQKIVVNGKDVSQDFLLSATASLGSFKNFPAIWYSYRF